MAADLHDRLTAYAERSHRSVSSAAEHLIAIALDCPRKIL